MVQFSHLYMTMGKTIALTIQAKWYLCFLNTLCRWNWKELKCRPLSLHSCEMSYLLSKWKEIFSPALSKVIRLWAQWITSHMLCKSHFLILYTSDSLLSWLLVCSDQDTLLLGKFQWLPIVYRMKERLSFVFKYLLHLAFIISLK